MINIGIIGCGAITHYRHAPECDKSIDANVGGFFDIRKERAEELAAQYGGKAYDDYKDMLADENIHGVCICTANKYHASMTIEALRAGKHVLCEKPMATSEIEAIEMIEEAKKANRHLMIAHNQRLAAVHQKAKEILNSGEPGRILSFNTVFGTAGPQAWSVDKAQSWFFRSGEAFSGAVADLGIHKADLIQWLIGDDITEISAFLAALDKKTPDGKMIDIDDNAVCILKSKTGIIGTLRASWTFYGEGEDYTILYCSNGMIKVSFNSEYSVEFLKSNGEKVSYKIPPDTNSGIIDAFVQSIKTGTKPEICGEEGLKALKVILACIKSSESGTKVDI